MNFEADGDADASSFSHAIGRPIMWKGDAPLIPNTVCTSLFLLVCTSQITGCSPGLAVSCAPHALVGAINPLRQIASQM